MAASARIPYNASSIGGQHLAAAARYSILAKQELDRANFIADAVANGTTANLDNSTEFGTNGAGTGATLAAFIDGFKTLLDAIPAAELAKLDQG